MSFRPILVLTALWLAASTAAFGGEAGPLAEITRLSGSYWGIAQNPQASVAVGTGGAFARKAAGGEWTASQQPGKPLLLAVDAAGDGSFVAVGGTGFTSGEGVILLSRDDGKSFQRVARAPAPLYEVKFVTPEAGYAAGVDGVVMTSRDGGESWRRVETGRKTKFWGLHFFSESNGLAAGGETPWQNDDRSSGEILRTEDGGKTWVKVYEGPKRISDFSFLSDQTGYAAGVGGLLLKTGDGGRTWSDAGRTPLKAIVNAVAFISEACGLVVGAGGTAYVTRDGGRSWNGKITVTDGSFLEDLAPHADPADVSGDGKSFWVAGGDGSLGRIDLGDACGL